jgi:hypothetical protein
MRVAPAAVIAALEDAGLHAWVSSIVLPDQYIVEARLMPSGLHALPQSRSGL